MSEQATDQTDSEPTIEVSDQNREEQHEGAVPDHGEDRPVDPAPEDEAS